MTREEKIYHLKKYNWLTVDQRTASWGHGRCMICLNCVPSYKTNKSNWPICLECETESLSWTQNLFYVRI